MDGRLRAQQGLEILGRDHVGEFDELDIVARIEERSSRRRERFRDEDFLFVAMHWNLSLVVVGIPPVPPMMLPTYRGWIGTATLRLTPSAVLRQAELILPSEQHVRRETS